MTFGWLYVLLWKIKVMISKTNIFSFYKSLAVRNLIISKQCSGLILAYHMVYGFKLFHKHPFLTLVMACCSLQHISTYPCSAKHIMRRYQIALNACIHVWISKYHRKVFKRFTIVARGHEYLAHFNILNLLDVKSKIFRGLQICHL